MKGSRYLLMLAVLSLLGCQRSELGTSGVADKPGSDGSGIARADSAHPPFLEPDAVASSPRESGSSAWVPGVGLPDGDRGDKRFGLLLVAPRRGEVGATFNGVAGLQTLGASLGFDYRNDGLCTKNSPAIVVKWANGRTDTYGCAAGRRQPAPEDPEHWTRVTFDPIPAHFGAPPISDLRIVFNVPSKSIVIDNFRLITSVIGWPGLSIYVADTGNHRIVRIDNWTASGWVAKWSSFGSHGNGIAQFNEPRDVYVDAYGKIYIADTRNHRIVRINDMSGAGWTTLGTGSCGTTVGVFCNPISVSVDGSGRIYVAEAHFSNLPTGNGATNRIVRVNDMSGAGWTQFGTFGAGVGQFSAPAAVRYDGAWRLYVADLFNGRVVRVDDMTGAGWQTLSSTPCAQGASPGIGQPFRLALEAGGRLYVLTYNRLIRFNDINGSGCVRRADIWDPQRNSFEWSGDGIALDSYNRIYTTDGHPSGASRIRRMLDMNGAGWITFGSRGSGVNQFENPTGIAVVGEEPSPFKGP